MRESVEANQKYRAFAKKAQKEGFANIAKLFLTTAEAERIHRMIKRAKNIRRIRNAKRWNRRCSHVR